MVQGPPSFPRGPHQHWDFDVTYNDADTKKADSTENGSLATPDETHTVSLRKTQAHGYTAVLKSKPDSVITGEIHKANPLYGDKVVTFRSPEGATLSKLYLVKTDKGAQLTENKMLAKEQKAARRQKELKNARILHKHDNGGRSSLKNLMKEGGWGITKNFFKAINKVSGSWTAFHHVVISDKTHVRVGPPAAKGRPVPEIEVRTDYTDGGSVHKHAIHAEHDRKGSRQLAYARQTHDKDTLIKQFAASDESWYEPKGTPGEILGSKNLDRAWAYKDEKTNAVQSQLPRMIGAVRSTAMYAALYPDQGQEEGEKAPITVADLSRFADEYRKDNKQSEVEWALTFLEEQVATQQPDPSMELDTFINSLRAAKGETRIAGKLPHQDANNITATKLKSDRDLVCALLNDAVGDQELTAANFTQIKQQVMSEVRDAATKSEQAIADLRRLTKMDICRELDYDLKLLVQLIQIKTVQNIHGQDVQIIDVPTTQIEALRDTYLQHIDQRKSVGNLNEDEADALHDFVETKMSLVRGWILQCSVKNNPTLQLNNLISFKEDTRLDTHLKNLNEDAFIQSLTAPLNQPAESLARAEDLFAFLEEQLSTEKKLTVRYNTATELRTGPDQSIEVRTDFTERTQGGKHSVFTRSSDDADALRSQLSAEEWYEPVPLENKAPQKNTLDKDADLIYGLIDAEIEKEQQQFAEDYPGQTFVMTKERLQGCKERVIATLQEKISENDNMLARHRPAIDALKADLVALASSWQPIQSKQYFISAEAGAEQIAKLKELSTFYTVNKRKGVVIAGSNKSSLSQFARDDKRCKENGLTNQEKTNLRQLMQANIYTNEIFVPEDQLAKLPRNKNGDLKIPKSTYERLTPGILVRVDGNSDPKLQRTIENLQSESDLVTVKNPSEPRLRRDPQDEIRLREKHLAPIAERLAEQKEELQRVQHQLSAIDNDMQNTTLTEQRDNLLAAIKNDEELYEVLDTEMRSILEIAKRYQTDLSAGQAVHQRVMQNKDNQAEFNETLTNIVDGAIEDSFASFLDKPLNDPDEALNKAEKFFSEMEQALPNGQQ